MEITLTESLSFNGPVYGGSQNHPYFGSVYDYFVEHLAGYSETRSFGQHDYEISPDFPHDLTEVTYSIETKAGLVEIEWSNIISHYVSYSVTIPPNTNLLFIPPANAYLENVNSSVVTDDPIIQKMKYGYSTVLKNGQYTFLFNLSKNPEVPRNQGEGELELHNGILFYTNPKAQDLKEGTIELYTLKGEKILERSINTFDAYSTQLVEVQSKINKHGMVIAYFQLYTDQTTKPLF